MNEKFTIENPKVGNVIICDFLGLKLKKIKLPFGDQEAGKEIQVLDTKGTPFEFCDGYQLEHLKFHSSYDWIIPVWQYIRGIENDSVVVDECTITTTKSIIKALPIPYSKGKSFISFYMTTDFNIDLNVVIWLTVIEFIKWYKEQMNEYHGDYTDA